MLGLLPVSLAFIARLSSGYSFERLDKGAVFLFFLHNPVS